MTDLSSKQGQGGKEGAETHFGSTLPVVGHPGASCPILFHPPWLSLHTFPHPLLFSPSPKWYLGFYFGARVPFTISHAANTMGHRWPPITAPVLGAAAFPLPCLGESHPSCRQSPGGSLFASYPNAEVYSTSGSLSLPFWGTFLPVFILGDVL